jgi:hypothetical protein
MMALKKYLLFLICFFAMLDISNSFERTVINYGVKAGVNFATLNGENSSLTVGNSLIDASSKISAVAGAFALYKPSKSFGIQPELLLSMKGVDFDADEYLHTWSIWYIEVPVLFKSIFEMKDNTSGSFYAGPAVAYKIKSIWGERYLDDWINEGEPLHGISNFDFSAVIGASMDMELFTGRVGIDLRYTYGLLSIQKSVSVQNGCISATLFYVFDTDSRDW